MIQKQAEATGPGRKDRVQGQAETTGSGREDRDTQPHTRDKVRLPLGAMLRPPHLHFGTHVLTFIHTSIMCLEGHRDWMTVAHISHELSVCSRK